MSAESPEPAFQPSSVIELMRAHRSIRAFLSDPVPDSWIEKVITTGQWASSSSFRQTYSVIAVKDSDRRGELRQWCGGQRWVEECPVFLIFCTDLNRLDEICRQRGLEVSLEVSETFTMAAIDVALFMQNSALAAEALGLGVVMIGGVRDNPREMIRILELPRGVFPISGMCLGFPESIPGQRPRLPLEEVLHWERYNSQGRAERLQAYDEAIRAAGVYRRKDGTLDGWTDVMARTTSKPPAQEGRRLQRLILQEQGFEMK